MRDRQGVRQDQYAGGFFPLLVLLVAFVFVAPLLASSTVGRIALTLLFYTAMLVAVRTSVPHDSILFIVFVVSAFAWVAFAVDQILDMPALELASRILNPVLLLVTSLTVLSGTSKTERVTMNTVFGAVCVYFLIALFWAFIFLQTERIDPGSFNLPDGPRQRLSDYVYFAFVTQTTLGYGDITPASDYARSFTIMAAFIGQIYVVVTIARLVSLQVVYSSRRPQGSTDTLPAGREANPQATLMGGTRSARPQDPEDHADLDKG